MEKEAEQALKTRTVVIAVASRPQVGLITVSGHGAMRQREERRRAAGTPWGTRRSAHQGRLSSYTERSSPRAVSEDDESRARQVAACLEEARRSLLHRLFSCGTRQRAPFRRGEHQPMTGHRKRPEKGPNMPMQAVGAGRERCECCDKLTARSWEAKTYSR